MTDRPRPPSTPSVADLMARLPVGYSEVQHRGRRWSVTRTVQQDGRVQKLWAEELGGQDVVSANLYLTGTGEQLRPCEMPASKVLDLLTGWRVLPLSRRCGARGPAGRRTPAPPSAGRG